MNTNTHLTPEPPRKPSSQPGVHSGASLAEERSRLRRTYEPHLVSCTVPSFLDRYAKRTREGGEQLVTAKLLEAVKDCLGQHVLDPEGHKLTKDSKNPIFHKDKGWRPLTAARESKLTEDQTYSKIGDISEAIGIAAIKHDPTLERERLSALKGTGTKGVTSEIPTFSARPDIRAFPVKSKLACFMDGISVDDSTPVPTRRTSPRTATREKSEALAAKEEIELPPEAAATSVIAEVKLKDTKANQEDDELKLIGGATTIMANDPRRRFLLGFTIECDIARLWHFGRGHICRSAPFNIQAEPDFLIHFLLFVMFATPVELGFDPTIKRRRDGTTAEIFYEYKVDKEYYVTVGPPISEERAHEIPSRATRVWVVQKIKKRRKAEVLELENEFRVLKDAWLFSEAVLQKEIQAEIFSALLASDIKPEQYQPYFMEILHDWVVDIGEARGTKVADVSHKLPTEYTEATFTRAPIPKGGSITPGSQRSEEPVLDKAKNSTTRAPSPNALLHQRRKHVRTVFAEHCETVFEVEDVKSMVKTLDGVVNDWPTALFYMWKAGYVHRDVSAGNCLWNGEVGKLSDLEYAKKYDTLQKDDPLTGTEIFTAVEVTLGQYRYLPDPMPPKAERPRLGANTLEEMRLQVLQNADLRKLVERPPGRKTLLVPTFRFNFYHDLESVFWILAWFLHHRFPKAEWLHTNFPDHKYEPAFVESQLRASFHKSIYPVIGRQALFDSRVIVGLNEMRSMFKAIYPEALHSLPDLGLDLVETLVDRYKKLEIEDLEKHPSNGTYYWAERQFDEYLYLSILEWPFEKILENLQGYDNIPVQSMSGGMALTPSLAMKRKRAFTRGTGSSAAKKSNKGSASGKSEMSP
ncbi:hypothetical protein H0H92_005820 [Tricholoma furcatifolium]|nr:hypothetical protein H0H92_005820 [Tricholoma furcatifolium]